MAMRGLGQDLIFRARIEGGALARLAVLSPKAGPSCPKQALQKQAYSGSFNLQQVQFETSVFPVSPKETRPGKPGRGNQRLFYVAERSVVGLADKRCGVCVGRGAFGATANR